ncbi:hypothetical protein SEMRO_412_G137760.1 [Seminavis robusta]|uniref:Uncharacterized protein n=1 Tax=Seminavis robusta TaxID=568900 RepID=A0A9N8DWB4_9STRA|nr:hypothetical protein SEMRO_412_G137760.1 [Seminavis robusta]|eukprot:Sro412_g137760.1 n/a (414) ;mRNA; f:4886-6571
MSDKPPGKKPPSKKNPYVKKKTSQRPLARMSTAGRMEDKMKEHQKKYQMNQSRYASSSSSSSTTTGSASASSNRRSNSGGVQRKIPARYPPNIRPLTLHTLLTKIDTSVSEDEVLTSPAMSPRGSGPPAGPSVRDAIQTDIKELGPSTDDKEEEERDEFPLCKEEKELLRLEDEVSVALMCLANGDFVGGKVVTCDPSFLSSPMKTVFCFEWWQRPPKPHEWWRIPRSSGTGQDKDDDGGGKAPARGSKTPGRKTPGRRPLDKKKKSMTPKKRGTPEASSSSSKRRTPDSVASTCSGRGTKKDPVVPFGIFPQDDDIDNLPPIPRKSGKTFEAKTKTLFCEQPSQLTRASKESSDDSSKDDSSMIHLPNASPSMSSVSVDSAARERQLELEAIFEAGRKERGSDSEEDNDHHD